MLPIHAINMSIKKVYGALIHPCYNLLDDIGFELQHAFPLCWAEKFRGTAMKCPDSLLVPCLALRSPIADIVSALVPGMLWRPPGPNHGLVAIT